MAKEYTPQEIQELLDEYTSSFDSVTGQLKVSEAQFARLSRELNEATGSLDTYTKNMNANLNKLGTSMKGLGTSLLQGKSGASVFNDSIGSAAKVVDTFASQFGIFGRILGAAVTGAAKYVEAVNKQADALFNSYQELSRSGLANGMQDIFTNLQNMGYTMEEIGNMSGVLKANSAELANFGGTAAQGAQRFAQIAKGLQEGNVGQQLKRMGMNVDNINSGLAGYIKIQQLSGSTAKQTNEQLMSSARAYIEQQDILTKLTGASAQEQQAIQEKALAQSNFAVTMYELAQKAKAGDKNAEATANYYSSLVTEMGIKAPQHLNALLAKLSGTVTSPEFAQFQFAFPEMAQAIDSGKNNFTDSVNAMTRDIPNTLQNYGALGRQNMNDIVGNMSDLVRASGALPDNIDEALKTATLNQANSKAGVDKQVSAMVALTTSQRNTAQAYDRFINAGIEPTVTGMTHLASAAEAAATALEPLGTTVVNSISKALGFGPTTTPAASVGRPGAASATVQIKNAQGQVSETRTGGSLNWRNNNPGNIEYGSFAVSMGAVGYNGRFAVFPTMEMGERAQDALLKSKNYANLNLQKAIARWAPASENDPTNYANVLAAKSGLALNKRYVDLTEAEQKKFRDVQNQIEGGTVGKVAAAGPTTPAASPVKATPAAPVPTSVPTAAPAPVPPAPVSSASLSAPKKTSSTTVREERPGDFPDTMESVNPLTGKRETISMNLPGARFGDILSGPTSGFAALLHGTEAVVPLPDGRSIPVQIMGGLPANNQLETIQSQMQNLVNAVIKSPDFGTMPQPAFSESAARESQTAQPQYVNQHGQEQTALLSIQIDKLDTLIRTMTSQTDISRKILQRQS